MFEGGLNTTSLGRFTGEREVGHQSFFTTITGNSLLWLRCFPFTSQRMTMLFFLLCSQLLLVGGVVKNITLSCKNISTGDGYTYQVSADIPSALLHDEDCEQAWYNETGEFVSDGQLHANQSKHRLVVDANRENITVSECIKLQHHVTCHGSSKEWKHFYQVNNDTSSPAPITAQQSHSIIIIIIISIILIGVLLGLLVWCCKQPRWRDWWQRLVRRDWRRSERGRRQRADEENRSNSIPLRKQEAALTLDDEHP